MSTRSRHETAAIPAHLPICRSHPASNVVPSADAPTHPPRRNADRGVSYLRTMTAIGRRLDRRIIVTYREVVQAEPKYQHPYGATAYKTGVCAHVNWYVRAYVHARTPCMWMGRHVCLRVHVRVQMDADADEQICTCVCTHVSALIRVPTQLWAASTSPRNSCSRRWLERRSLRHFMWSWTYKRNGNLENMTGWQCLFA